MVDEMLNELVRTSIFSKLDLKSCCHQIKMCEKDIPKTTFPAHEGHYEFWSCLTNAPIHFSSSHEYCFETLS